jgi:bifunctional DNA-binding transcriptional regulator/antitoxin component of YhaV-PrlF toxin-antitoxin module
MAVMASKIEKQRKRRIVALPAELLAQLGWDVGDVLAAEVFEGGIRLIRTKTEHEHAMQIARRGMHKYREAMEKLAKS